MMTGNKKVVEKGNLSEIDHLLICSALKKQSPLFFFFFQTHFMCDFFTGND